MSNYTLHDLHGSINDIYEQFDSGKITESMAIEILSACCKVFIENSKKPHIKLFKATWGDEYAFPDSRVITLDDITEENGWHDYCIEWINLAKVGEIVDCSDIGGVVHVERIQ